MITQAEYTKIKELRDSGKSGAQISKEIGKRKQDVLEIIRNIEGKHKIKSSKLIYTPIKYLKPKQLIKKEKIIVKRKEIRIKKLPLSKKEKDFINKSVRKNESDYKIIKEFKGREKKVLKEIKKYKNKEKKEKLKTVNDTYKERGFNCNFNYITQHHIGYILEKACTFIIYSGMPHNDLIPINNDIIKKLEILNIKVLCNQRFNYCSLEYKIYFDEKYINDISDFKKDSEGKFQLSKISTNINTSEGGANFKNMASQIIDVLTFLWDLVHQSGSPRLIEIYNIIYVNYDFKNNVK